MSYIVVLQKKYHKVIEKFTPTEQARVYQQLKALELNPRPPGKKIKSFVGIKSGFRLRIGDLRVIYMVDDKTKQVLVLDVGRRGDIY